MDMSVEMSGPSPVTGCISGVTDMSPWFRDISRIRSTGILSFSMGSIPDEDIRAMIAESYEAVSRQPDQKDLLGGETDPEGLCGNILSGGGGGRRRKDGSGSRKRTAQES